MVTKMQFDPAFEEILRRSRPMGYPIFKTVVKHSKYHSYLHKSSPNEYLSKVDPNSPKLLNACDANITQFTSAQIKENMYSIMQEENNLTSPSKKRYHEEPLVQALDISMIKGLTKVGYRSLLQENEKTLPSDINATLSATCETEEEKVIHLAQMMLDSPMLDNIAYACNKHYAETNPDRVPLYMRKSWKTGEN